MRHVASATGEKVIQLKKGLKLYSLRPFFVNRIGFYSNQLREDLKRLYVFKSLVVSREN
jgi:hypothetical protein